MIPQPLSRDVALADIRRRLNDLESSPNLYGAVITGSTMQTDTTDTGFKITTDGIRQYDDTGSVLSSWTDDGIDLQDAVLTGGTYQTAASGKRVEISAEYFGRIRFWPNDDPDYRSDILCGSGLMQIDIGGGPSEAGRMKIASDSLDFAVNGVYRMQVNDDYVRFATPGDCDIDVEGDVYLTAGTEGDVNLTAGTDADASVYLINLPSVVGQTANVYMDPTTGKLSRIT